MRLPDSDLSILRSQPQQTDLFLSIFTPREIFSAQVTGSVSRGAREIPYYNPSGSVDSIEAGMTLLVGTSAGGRELGKIRIKSASASQLVVSENSHIDWASATHLTALRYWEVYPIYPRIIQDPNNAENVIFYKDYDIAYSDQNDLLGAFPCAGNHRALFKGEQSFWSSSGTTHLLGSGLSYDWAFEGGTPTGSTSAVPGNVTYNTAGQFVTRLRVSGSNGTIDTTYRYVSVYEDPRSSAVNLPVKNWSLTNIDGSRDEGGYTASFSISNEDIELHDGDVAVLFSDDYYGSTHQSIGGNSHNNPRIFFVGHVLGNSIRYDYKRTVVDFQVASITELMKQSEGFSVSVESKSDPTTWYELLDMDGRRAIYHYLKWHTTVLSLADFQFVGQDQKVQFFDSDRESMFDAIDNYMRGTLLGKVCSDRQGKIWAEVGAWAYPNPTGSFPPVMNLEKSDWIGELQIVERLFPELSSIELGGVAYSGATTGTFSALISSAPGLAPNFRGSAETHQGLALESQEQLNDLAGNIYANRTARFPEISANLSESLRNLDIAPQETVRVSASADDTNIRTSISAPYLIDAMRWEYNSANKMLLPSFTLKSMLNGSDGETVTIPDVPESGGYAEGGNFSFGRISGFPPSLSSLGAIQAFINTVGSAANPTSDPSILREMNFFSTSYSFGGFYTLSQVSEYSTGTSVNRVFVPYAGYYWVNGEAGFSNIGGTDGYMRIQAGGNILSSQYASADAGYGAGAFYSAHISGLMYINSPSTQPIIMLTAVNSSFVNISGVLNIFLMRLA